MLVILYKICSHCPLDPGADSNRIMKLDNFDYDLPKQLIASHPCAERSHSRLLHVKNQHQHEHLQFQDIISLLQPEDLLVLNTTKVIKARLFGRKQSGGKLECLIERIQDERSAWAHIGCSKTPKPGSQIVINGALIEVLEREQDLFLLQLPPTLNWDQFLNDYGEIPLPPYIERDLMPEDQMRYQTVYAKQEGAVAAPTAGLHFDQMLLEQIKARNIKVAELILHVGAGTFQTVRSDDITQHHMHAERIEVNEDCVQQIKDTKQRGGSCSKNKSCSRSKTSIRAPLMTIWLPGFGVLLQPICAQALRSSWMRSIRHSNFPPDCLRPNNRALMTLVVLSTSRSSGCSSDMIS